MIIALSSTELIVLEGLELPETIMRILRESGGYDLSSDEWEVVAEACMDRFQEKGWDEEYTVTEYGIVLQGLIDKMIDPGAPSSQKRVR